MTLPPFFRRILTVPAVLRTRPRKRWLAYGALALVSFVFALRQTFPVEAVAERLVLEAAARGWELRMTDVAPAGFVGVRLSGVTLEVASGARLPVDDVSARVRLLPLVVGRRGVDFDAQLLGGTVRGSAEQRATSQRLVARVDEVQLGNAVVTRRLTGVDLAGALSGDVDLALDLAEPAKSSGRIDLAVADAAVQGGEVKVAAMGGGALTLPRIDLGAVTAKAGVQDGKATFETLTAKGGDVEVEGEGLYFVVQPRAAQAPLFGRARLRFSEELWKRNGTSGLRGIVEMALAPAKARDGSYAFQLFGTLSAPQARPAPAGP